MSYRPQITNRAGVAKHAAPEAIAAHLAAATKAQIEATREVAWLTQLLEERQHQVAAGEWPPPAKTEVLTVRFTEAEAEALQRYANERTQSVSEALREIISMALGSTPDTGSTTADDGTDNRYRWPDGTPDEEA